MKNYIQIGSNVGADHFFSMCLNLDEPSNIYLIEPNSDLILKLIKNYETVKQKHNVHIFNIGIVTEGTKDVNTLYFYENDNVFQSGMSSILKRKSHQQIIGKTNFIPELFSSFCQKNKILNIELLSIDTEGFDYEILNSIDPTLIDIKKIYFEYWPFENDDIEQKVNTGNSFLKIVMNKYKNYILTDTFLDGQKSYFLEKIQ
jgi:FkbM family methyltransferase